ncbi:hypothetical protein Nmel_004444, partial [Mimus melanotis]
MRGGPAARARAGPAPSPCALHNVPTCAAFTCHNSAGTGGDRANRGAPRGGGRGRAARAHVPGRTAARGEGRG